MEVQESSLTLITVTEIVGELPKRYNACLLGVTSSDVLCTDDCRRPRRYFTLALALSRLIGSRLLVRPSIRSVCRRFISPSRSLAATVADRRSIFGNFKSRSTARTRAFSPLSGEVTWRRRRRHTRRTWQYRSSYLAKPIFQVTYKSPVIL